jgi:hypothetical protein
LRYSILLILVFIVGCPASIKWEIVNISGENISVHSGFDRHKLKSIEAGNTSVVKMAVERCIMISSGIRDNFYLIDYSEIKLLSDKVKENIRMKLVFDGENLYYKYNGLEEARIYFKNVNGTEKEVC